MRTQRPLLYILLAALPGLALAHDLGVTESSRAWNWAEGRETPILATAQCGGKYFESEALTKLKYQISEFSSLPVGLLSHQNRNCSPDVNDDLNAAIFKPSNAAAQNIQFQQPLLPLVPKNVTLVVPPLQVQTYGSDTVYLSESEKSPALAREEMENVLKRQCAEYAYAELKNLDSTFAATHRLADVRLTIELKNLSFSPRPLTDAQKASIVKRLNAAHSCSDYEAFINGVKQVSNCDSTGMGINIIKKANDYDRMRPWRIAVGTIVGGLCNRIRGGLGHFGSTQEARLVSAYCLSTIPLVVRGDTLFFDPAALAASLPYILRVFAGFTMYSAKDHVGGGRFGTSNTLKAITSGAIQGIEHNYIVCGDGCKGYGVSEGLLYTTVAAMADKEYHIAGTIDGNEVSEVAVGLFQGNFLAKQAAEAYRANLIRDYLAASSRTVHVDLADILPK